MFVKRVMILLVFIGLCFSNLYGADTDAKKIQDIIKISEKFKKNTIVFKGFYLGMQINDAKLLLDNYINNYGINFKINEIKDGRFLLSDKEAKYVTIQSDTNGNVIYFKLKKQITDILFDSSDMDRNDFLQTFINAYNIKELKPLTKKIDSGMGQIIGYQSIYQYKTNNYELNFYEDLNADKGELLGVIMTRQMFGMPAGFEDAGTFELIKLQNSKQKVNKFD